jgi:molecular chaperone DnaJ
VSKDYYKILGVEKNASADEIKKAFRKLAHEHHPDKQGGDEAKFKEVNEAYQVLSNAEKRQKYDQFGSDFAEQGGFGGGMNWDDFMRAARGGQGGARGFDGMDLGDLFGAFGFGGGGGQRRQKRGNDVQVDVRLEFRDAAFGVEREIRLMKNNACDVCRGSGAEPGSTMKQCEECKGAGQVRRVQQTILGAMQTVNTCRICSGRGNTPEKRCKHCGGDGVVRSESRYTIKIPAGIADGESIRLTGKGETVSGGEAGDLYVMVHVQDDPRFVREGFDIYTEKHISYPQAALGADVAVDTLDGEKTIKVPEGTQSGQRIRLKGLGVPYLQRSGRADHYVQIIVDIPKKVSRKARKLLEELSGELES